MRGWWKRIQSGAVDTTPPLRLDELALDRHDWTYVVDVAVVGFGGAGVAAALEARAQGARVAAVERFSGGGSTAISGGIVYAGGGTSVQADAGVEDSSENMFNYLIQETGDAVCEDTLRQFCEDSAGNLEWLRELGVPFEASLCPFKTSYPSNEYYYYYSGNESFPPYSDKARPAPRGHRAHGRGVSGAALFEPLRRAALAGGVSILSQHRARGLITNADGAVLGVQLSRMPAGSLAAWLHRQLYALLIFCRYLTIYLAPVMWLLRWALESLEAAHAETASLRAHRGVIISTGGFFFNQDMLRQYAPEHLPGIPLGTIADDGSGILLGQSVGASTGMMHNVSQWRFINPPESYVRGILIDSEGNRICNEMLYGAQLSEQIMRRAGGQAWLLIDASLADQTLREIGPNRAMWFQSAAALMFLFMARRKASTLLQLAAKLHMPVENLQRTVNDYNALSEKGAEDPFGKPAEHRAVLQQGPWYALDCRVDGAVRNPSITLGGLRVDEKTGQVLADKGGVIKGLYAAGRSAVGIASHSYVSGLSIAGCIFSGRRAGHHAGGQQKQA